jgi:hypothetical protein
MKPLCTSLLACAIAAFTGTALASSGSLVQFKPKVMPVVVQVNSQGRVTDILPSRQLTPQMRQMLVKQLDAWIVKPAIVKGHPVASRFIIDVAMHTQPRKDGKYDANFVYVKSLAMPFAGAVHWDVINGGLELALVSDEDGARSVHHRLYFRNFPRGGNYYGPRSAQSPRVAGTPRPASVAASPLPVMSAAMSTAPAFPVRAAARSNGAPPAARQ